MLKHSAHIFTVAQLWLRGDKSNTALHFTNTRRTDVLILQTEYSPLCRHTQLTKSSRCTERGRGWKGEKGVGTSVSTKTVFYPNLCTGMNSILLTTLSEATFFMNYLKPCHMHSTPFWSLSRLSVTRVALNFHQATRSLSRNMDKKTAFILRNIVKKVK
jgi:hypothetical protein